MEGASRRRFWPEMEKMVTSRRLRGLWSGLGGALGSQGGGEHRGQLNLMRGGSSTANLDGDEMLLLGAPVAEKRSVLAGEKGTSRSWLPAGAPHRHGREHARGRGKTVAMRWHSPINSRLSTAMNRSQSLSPPFSQSTLCLFVKCNQTLNRSQNFIKIKVVQNFVSYKTSFGGQSQI